MADYIHNPLKYIDPDGMRIVLPNSSQANVFASDLNRIYQNKYGVDNAFNVVTRDVQVSRKKPEYGFLDRINPFSTTPEFIETTESRSFVETSGDFDWNSDQYTSAIKDVIDADTDIMVNIIDDKGSEASSVLFGSDMGLLAGAGGGFTKNSSTVLLSDKLSETKVGDDFSNTVNWTLGGVGLHELLYYIHPQGKNKDERANSLRKYYNQRTGPNMARAKDKT